MFVGKQKDVSHWGKSVCSEAFYIEGLQQQWQPQFAQEVKWVTRWICSINIINTCLVFGSVDDHFVNEWNVVQSVCI